MSKKVYFVKWPSYPLCCCRWYCVSLDYVVSYDNAIFYLLCQGRLPSTQLFPFGWILDPFVFSVDDFITQRVFRIILKNFSELMFNRPLSIKNKEKVNYKEKCWESGKILDTLIFSLWHMSPVFLLIWHRI